LTGQRTLEDPIGIFGKQLIALGHQAVWAPANDKFLCRDTGINVIVEGFSTATIAAIAEGHGNGARFIMLATEEPTPKGFNHGWDPAMVQRQKIFPEAAKFFEAIFHLVPGEEVTRWYSQFAPSAYVELGYAPALVRPRESFQPDFDYGFYGTMSKRRVQILKRLQRHTGGRINVIADFKTQVARDHEMRRCKVILQIRKQESMGLVSSSRCNTALCLGRPVVAEPHDLCKPWDEVVWFSKTMDRFYDDCLMVKATWRGTWAAQFDRFKEKFPPERCVGDPMRAVGLDLSLSAAA
jgi:hypothetical protein